MRYAVLTSPSASFLETNSSIFQLTLEMGVFFMAMVLYPDAQKKAQAELDAVVGTGRLPEFTDHKSLPYVSALVKEVLRWHCGTPLGLAHRAVADDEYNGHLIPGGATVLVNMWFVPAHSSAVFAS